MKYNIVNLAFVAIALMLVSSPASLAAKPISGSKPNIIFVMTDDQGMGDPSCMGNPVLKTPHLDRFYESSTRFTDFQVSPTCAPTRAAIMSGRHEFRNGVTHTIEERELRYSDYIAAIFSMISTLRFE